MDAANMKTLDEIMIRHGSDKATVFTRIASPAHGYTVHLAKFFDPIRFDHLKLVEIGVGGGESIRGWLEYFQFAQVYGVDIVGNTNEWNTPGQFRTRYAFNCADQSDHVFWKCWLANYPEPIDIVIDDGGHFNDGIITSFNALWPAVKPGGFYAIEDLGCSYGAGSIFVKPGFPAHMDWIHDRIDNLNIGTGIDSIYMSKELCILRKAL